MFFSRAFLLLSEDGGELRPVSWLYCARGGYGVTRRKCDSENCCCSRQLCGTMEVFCRRVYQLGDQCWSKMSGNLRKPLGLESKTYTKRIVLTCIIDRWWHAREFFQSIPFDRAGLRKRASHHTAARVCLVRAVWRCLEENLVGFYGERVKLMSWGRAMRVGLLNAPENGCCSCWTTWPWFWVLQRVAVGRPNLNHTSREICVISLATFTIPVCR